MINLYLTIITQFISKVIRNLWQFMPHALYSVQLFITYLCVPTSTISAHSLYWIVVYCEPCSWQFHPLGCSSCQVLILSSSSFVLASLPMVERNRHCHSHYWPDFLQNSHYTITICAMYKIPYIPNIWSGHSLVPLFMYPTAKSSLLDTYSLPNCAKISFFKAVGVEIWLLSIFLRI